METQNNYNFTQWFETRNLKQLGYQQGKMQQVITSIANQELPTVFAATPSAGKTLMSICMIDTILKDNPSFRVLILAHGTTVLRSQYYEEIVERNPSFTHCEIESKSDMDGCDAQVVVAIPQTLDKLKELPEFQFLVVDEAHQFYFKEAGMVQRIIQKAKVKHQLMLTGTPSPFVKRDYPLITVPLSELMEYGMVAPLTFVMATSKYNIRSNQFTNSGEVNDSFDFTEEDTNHTLDNFLTVMKENLLKIEGQLYPSEDGNEWASALKQMDKTMIACKSVPQAYHVKRYLNQKGIDVALSTAEHDNESAEIKRFKEDENCRVLIVVYRGILGFSFPEMINLIDMSAMQNLDRIFQLIGRLIRLHPEGRRKFFFKVVPEGLEEEYKRIMSATLCLCDEEYFTKYDGENFLGVRIPGTKPEPGRPPQIDDIDDGDDDGDQTPPPPFVPNTDWLGLPDGLNFFKDLLFKTRNKTVENYAFASIREIKIQLGEMRDANLPYFWNFERCLEDALNYSSRMEWKENSSAAYRVALKNHWVDECCEHMAVKINHGQWNSYEACKEEALKYTNKTDWMKNSRGSYAAAKKHGWFDEISNHMGGPVFWTKEKCIEEAKKYKTKKEWMKNSAGSYSYATKNGFFDECTTHMNELLKPKGYWTLERCLEESKQYNSKKEWMENSSTSYYAAHKNGWVNECSTHMTGGRKKSK